MNRLRNILNGSFDNEEERFDFALERKQRKTRKKVKTVKVKQVIKESDVSIPPPHPNLLPIPFSLLVVARKGSGKTVMVQYLLDIYHKYFDNIYIISPTANLDFKWIKMIEKLNIPHEHVFEGYNEKKMSALLESIKNINEGKKNKDKMKCLLIFDDAVEQMPHGSTRKGALIKLAFNLRHYAISTIIVSQAFKMLHPNLRVNASGYILYGTDNVAERGKIIEEISGNIGRKKFERLWLETVSKKFDFLFINYEDRKLYRNFETVIGDLDQLPVLLFDNVDKEKKKEPEIKKEINEKKQIEKND